MAAQAQKKQTASGSRKKTTTGTSAKSSRKKSTGSSKQSAAKRKKAERYQAEKDSQIFHEIGVLLLFALMAFFFLCNFGILGPAGNSISGFMFGMFGASAYILPIALFVGVAFWMANEGYPAAARKLAAGAVLFLMFGVVCDLVVKEAASMTEYDIRILYDNCREKKHGGGILAGSLCYFLLHYLEKAGTILILVIISLVCLILLTEKSLISGIRKGTSRVVEKTKQDTEHRQQMAELRREASRRRRQERQDYVMQKRLEERDQKELRRQQAEEKEDEKILRMEKRVSGVTIDTSLGQRKPVRKRSDDVHEIILEQEPDLPGTAESFEDGQNPEYIPEYGQENYTGENSKEESPWEEDTREENGKTKDPFSGLAEESDYRDEAVENLPDAFREVVPEIQNDFHGSYAEEYTDENTDENLQDSIEQFDEKTSKSASADFSAGAVTKTAVPGAAARTVTSGTAARTITPGIAASEISGQDMDSIQVYSEVNPPKNEEAGAASPEKRMHITHEAGPYHFPPLSLLKKGAGIPADMSLELKETALRLQQTLATFGVGVTITDISQGPTVTRYELQPEQGVKVSRIVNLSDDIKLNLAATDIRIEAPIPGKAAIGIEVPNKETMPVALRDLLESSRFRDFPSNIAFAVGKDIAGQVVVADIAKMPHMLIAGATGSGKSVCINTLIMSILYKAHPDDVKLILVDPKVVELSVYNGIPHLLIPVVTDPKKASAALQWGVSEMTDRYKKFAEYNVRDLKGYNKKVLQMKEEGKEDAPPKLPQIVIIVDELADLMMVCPGEVEESICRLAQLARAAGIHLIIATQRPSVDVITGLIKANMPSRVAFSVSSGVDSRTILDMNGAEKLLGKGDMLFYPQGYSKPARIQGAFVSDKEVSDVVDFLKNQAIGNVYASEIEEQLKNMGSGGGGLGALSGSGDGRDEYFAEAGRFIIDKDKASIGMLQRVFKIGFNRAARIMDQLEEYGVVGEEEGTKPRKILMSPEQFEQLLEEI